MSGHLVFGIHPIETLLRTEPGRVLSLRLGDRQDRRIASILALASDAGVTVISTTKDELDTEAGGGRHQGIIATVEPAQVRNEAFLKDLVAATGRETFLLVLDEVQDPHNLGACLRSADGAGAQAVIIPKRRSAGLTAATRKVASGAAETVPLIRVNNLARSMKWLANQGVTLIGLAGDSETPLFDQELTGPLALVLGGEEQGLRRLTREHCDALVSLPMQGAIESLNVSVATGICLYEARRQRRHL